MKKNNSNGFALAETLIVTVFLMAIFTAIFVGVVPLIGEYDKRADYDDVNGKYATYWIKKMVEDPDYQLSAEEKNSFKVNKYVRFNCMNMGGDPVKKQICSNLVKSLQVKGCDDNGSNCEIFITPYQIGGNDLGDNSFKSKVKESSKSVFRTGLKNYIKYLPDYSAESLNSARFRVIVSYEHKKGNNNFYTYATMEVVR